MRDVDRKRVLDDALCIYGQEMQVIVAIEEMAELQKALTKWLRQFKDDSGDVQRGTIEEVQEEIADVQIMLDQLKLLFDKYNRIRMFENIKLDRLKRRIYG